VLEDEWRGNAEDRQKTFDLLGSRARETFWINTSMKHFRNGYHHEYCFFLLPEGLSLYF